VLLMIWFTFIAAALCYRENLHIAINLLPRFLPGRAGILHAWLRELLVGAASVFLLYYGVSLVQTTWYSWIAEFPSVSVGISYLPIPIGGGIMALFVLERLIRGPFIAEAPGDPIGGAEVTATVER
jgi:TRAP-type C4-dicarboxylate transport system permease small subunit